MWKWVDNMKESMNDLGTFKSFQDAITEIGKAVVDLFNSVKSLVKFLDDKGLWTRLGQMISDGILGVLKAIGVALDAITVGIQTIEGIGKGDLSKVDSPIVQGLSQPSSWIDNLKSWVGKSQQENPNGLMSLLPSFEDSYQDSLKILQNQKNLSDTILKNRVNQINATYPNKNISNSSNTTINQTNNVYGSDANATGKAIANNLDKTASLRGVQGVNP